ncbi:iron exporter MbfA [Bosea sp. (in: a-proteobacteria)]|uniref:iron exporter MbfA n=1 Tax=Bosea sp. (in: a-proteobacteria) TaxID=1871050 RepID=UPI0025C5D758|nr:ferritin family protein [Bosea sp. (in: a-proteobacteria)]
MPALFSMFRPARRRFDDLSTQEVLSLAILAEEEDGRIYSAYAANLSHDYPASAAMFDAMAAEENEHRSALLDLYVRRFGPTIIPIRREHVEGFYARKPLWLVKSLPLERARADAADMERQAETFYRLAASRSTDAETRKLLGDLAAAEAQHERKALSLEGELTTGDEGKAEQEQAKRQFVLTWVQPGLAGLMDGSVSTLAPIFATAFATQNPWTTFLIGLSASIGAGISMGFTEAAHDDGKLSGRGPPWKRGLASGVMTTIGGLGHALPYLIPHFWTATAIALCVVFVELWVIVWIQNRFMETPIGRAMFQIILGGLLVLATGILIGGS